MKTKTQNRQWTLLKIIPTFSNAPRAYLSAFILALTALARADAPPASFPISDIGAKATADYHGDALGITATSDGARLRCGFQKIEGHATPEGLWLESTAPGAAAKLRLVATALRSQDNSTVSSQSSTVLPATGTVSVEGKLVRFTRPGVTEEYSVSVDGVRQDFLITQRPEGMNELWVELSLNGARAEAGAGGARLMLNGSGRALAYTRLRAEDATGRELPAQLEVLSTDRLVVSVADTEATYPVRIDPTFSDADWVSLNPGRMVAYDTVNAMAVDDIGNLYVGGWITSIGTEATNKIAKWDGSTWSALGSGMDNSVYALAVSGTDLFAGGWFTSAGGVPVKCIAKWDGSTWSALGSGMNSGVFALAVSGTNLYAGGAFTKAGGVAANYIAKWDGSAWSGLGSGIGGQPMGRGLGVYALAVSGTNLYVGGDFTTAGGVPASDIAKWNGNSWLALGIVRGTGGIVQALAVSGTNLYAGGTFWDLGRPQEHYIAKWDGNAWSALGSGMDNSVYALAVIGTDVCAAGIFDTAGGVPVNNIAKWDGQTWSALGSGVSGGYPVLVSALATDGLGHLFVGGTFDMAGTNVSPYIAQASLAHLPNISIPPPTQTADIGSKVDFAVDATGGYLTYLWFFNGTNLLSTSSDCNLILENVGLAQLGAYTVVVTNMQGAATSAPVMLNVIPTVEHRPVPVINLNADSGSMLNLEYASSLNPAPDWFPLDSVILTSPPQFYFDLTQPLPPQRFYRVWQTGAPVVIPSLELHFVPAITLTGNIGDSLRIDYINQFGPTDAWMTLDTITLTNTSQLYFDVSAIGQPPRLWRIVPIP